MATTLLLAPDPLTPVRDPAWVNVSCDGYLTGAPSAHYIVLDAHAPHQPEAGDQVNFTVADGRTASLTAVTGSPDDSGTQFSIGANTAETFTNLINACARNYLITSSYVIETITTTAAKITSRATGHGVVVMATTSSAPWLTIASDHPGDDGGLKPNYRLGLAVFVEEEWDSGVYRRLPEYMLTPTAMEASADLSPLLRPFLKPVWPPMTGTAVIRSLALQRRYYFGHWEIYGDPPAARIVSFSGHPSATVPRIAMLAGTRQADHRRWAALSVRIRTTILAPVSPWLTYRGIGGRHEVSAEQRHYLGWWCGVTRIPGVEHTLRARVYYTDGSMTEANTAVSDASTGVQMGEVGQWPTGFDQLGLSAWSAGRVPYKYGVRIVGAASTAVSAEHVFWLAEPDSNELFIEFVNSFGVIESMRCVGRSAENLAGTYTSLTTALAPVGAAAPSPSRSANVQRLAGAQLSLEVFGGYVDAAEHEALLDVVTSPEVMLVDPKRNMRIPVRMAPGAHEVKTKGDDSEHLYSLTLKLDVHDPEMAWSRVTS